MELSLWKCGFTTFKLICITSAISMTIYCSYEYSKNEDLSVVSYKKFNEDEEGVYPQVVLCLYNHFSLESEEAKEIGYNITPGSFGRFYKGEEWNDAFLKIDINKIVRKFQSNVVDTCLFSEYPENENDSRECEGKGILSTHLDPFGGKCLQFHYKHPKRILEATMWLKTSIFPNDTGPNNMKFYPVTFMLPNRRFYINDFNELNWPIQENPADPYAIQYTLSNIEVIRNRGKSGSNCYDGKNYDAFRMKEILSTVGCKPFYYFTLPGDMYQNCTTQSQFKKLSELVMTASLRHSVPPCTKIQRMQINVENVPSELRKEKEIYSGIEKSLEAVNSWFRVTVNFRERYYRDITQTRAYSAQSLIGNAGGYIGLFIGYTIAELPLLLMAIYARLKIIFSFFSNPARNSISSKPNKNLNPMELEKTLVEISERMCKLELANNNLIRQVKNLEIEWKCQFNRSNGHADTEDEDK